ncbi:hypothetical protein QQG74_09680 [Micromonospora sp. FIMYZ51]|uniref:hypothetical protein n=1 Tax=Micromonospora sp. FIMYZ51 TaxID=3051832 RepID=UPI00311E465C
MRTAELDPFKVHIAAPPVGLVQRCAACQLVLMDNTAWVEGRVAVIEGDDAGPSWWPVGERIATDKTEARQPSITYVVAAGRTLDDDEQPCAGSN